MELSKEEMVLTTMIIVFSDDRNTLTDRESTVTGIQETYAMMLQQLMNLESQKQKRRGRNKFPVRI